MSTFDRHPYLKHSTAMPAHKDTQHPAGQVLPTVGELKGQQDLSDYIRSINRAQAFDDVAQEKRLTFKQAVGPIADKFFGYSPTVALDDYDDVLLWELIWNTALKHGKVS